MADAPFCNVSIASPDANPHKPIPLQQIPRNANLSQITNIVNNNFNALIKGNYREDRSLRRLQVVRVYDPSDPSSYVDVQQITGLTFVNATTGQTLTFSR